MNSYRKNKPLLRMLIFSLELHSTILKKIIKVVLKNNRDQSKKFNSTFFIYDFFPCQCRKVELIKQKN